MEERKVYIGNGRTILVKDSENTINCLNLKKLMSYYKNMAG